jgi:hypothetical protein
MANRTISLPAIALVFLGAVPCQANLIADPEFQHGIAGWEASGISPPPSWDTSLGFTDTMSLRGSGVLGPCFPVAPGTLLRGAAQVRTEDRSNCLAFPMFFQGASCTGNFTFIGSGDGFGTLPPGVWSTAQYTFAAPAGFQSVRLALFASVGSATCNYDSVYLGSPAVVDVPMLDPLGKVAFCLLIAACASAVLRMGRA